MADAGSGAAAATAQPGGTMTDELRAQFRQQIQLTAIRIPKQSTSQYMKLLSKHLFNKPRLQKVVRDPEDEELRLLLLDESLREADLASRHVEGAGGQTLAELLAERGLSLATAQVDVDYSYWPAHEVLRRLLPEGVEVPSAFESVGHIAHLNLRGELLPFKRLIGQVILDKNPRLKTVVNKVASIENEFRVFPMEVLAGEDGALETEVRQHGARFRLDFSKVYWNSRLEREHQRLVSLFAPGEAVLDAMAGIGPFAVPAAAKGCLVHRRRPGWPAARGCLARRRPRCSRAPLRARHPHVAHTPPTLPTLPTLRPRQVYANDLNPASYAYLCTNIRLNRLAGSVLPFCADARRFVRDAAAGRLDVAGAAAVVAPAPGRKGGQQQQPQQQQQQQQQQQSDRQQQQTGARQTAAPAPAGGAGAGRPGAAPGNAAFHHVVMNLPASAVEFLDALHGSFCPSLWAGRQLPLVHCYTFAKGEQEAAAVRQRVEAALGGPLPEAPAQHIVRDVAPGKIMLCVTFRLPASIAFAEGDSSKRQKVA